MENVDELLFKLCVLGGLADERGKLFLAKDNFCLAVEMLTPQVKLTVSLSILIYDMVLVVTTIENGEELCIRALRGQTVHWIGA